jgi:hypothetical protein
MQAQAVQDTKQALSGGARLNSSELTIRSFAGSKNTRGSPEPKVSTAGAKSSMATVMARARMAMALALKL